MSVIFKGVPAAIPFADFPEDIPEFVDIQSISARDSKYEKRVPTDRAETLYSEPCKACKGTGVFTGYTGRIIGTCFKCDGKKVLTFKTPKAARDSAKIKNAERKAAKEAANLLSVETEYPALKAWWTGSDFEFAVNMRDAVIKFGALTEKQLAAALKQANNFAAAKAEKQQAAVTAVANAPVVNVSAVVEAFNRAFTAGIKRPKMRVLAGDHRLVLSRAPDNGNNAGAVYVKERDTEAYLGKVLGGKFLKSRDCDDVTAEQVVQVCRDPLTAAVAYGRLLGECSVCGRTLSDPVSIANGIGPICQDKMFGM
jgi:hypothetical protein